MRFLAVSALSAIFAFSADAQLAADIVILNASVRTMAARQPKAEAIALTGNRITAVGTNAEIRKLVTGNTRTIDAGGNLVLPGFNDSHVHFMGVGSLFSTLNLRDITTADGLFDRLELYTKFLPKGRWILGSGGSDDLWKQIDGQKLDALTRDNPVFIYDASGRSAIANSLAIGAARVRETKSGVVAGQQLARIRYAVPADHAKRWADIAETASNYAVSFGITSLQDADSDDHAALYRELARSGKMKVRIYDCHSLSNWKKYADAGMKPTTGDALVRTGCLKGTAETDEKGKAALQRDVIAADKAGMQILLHAIGPAMNKTALDVFENAARTNGKRDRRFRIEHAERAASADVPRFGRLGVIASMQPYLFGWGVADAANFFTMLRTGTRVTFGSDAAMTDIDPLLGIMAAWNESRPDDSIKAYTLSPAYAEFQEDLKGTIEVGKLADLVILKENAFDRRAAEQKGTQVLFTIVDGKVVFQAD
jgi:predicted amidohydrolase YtcJ